MYRYMQSLAAFVAVGRTGAFVKAANELGVTASVVSHHITRLENELGETLVHRTTRKLSLSENGKRLFDAASQGLGNIEDAIESIRTGAHDIVGALRIALPAFAPDTDLEAKVMDFALRYPNVALTLDYTDHVVDLVEGGYDLSIRIGDMPDSALIRKKLGSVVHVLVAAPSLLMKHEPPVQPKDLEHLPFIAMGRSVDSLTLKRRTKERTVALEVCQLHVQSILAARTAALAGIGFASLPVALIKQDIADKRLVAVLPEWTLPRLNIQAVWSGSSGRRGLAKRFVDHITLD